jgi:hypothetical protein
MQRREFIRKATKRAAATAIPVAGAAYASSTELFGKLSDQIGKNAEILNAQVQRAADALHDEIRVAADGWQQQFRETADVFQGQVREIAATVQGVSGRVDMLELKYRLVMTLLVISMMIDGGMSWMLLQAPMPLVL